MLPRFFGDASQRAATVGQASEKALGNVQAVAAAAEELSASVAEISRQVAQSSEVARLAVGEAEQTNSTVQQLSGGAEKIGAVVQLIQSIAEHKARRHRRSLAISNPPRRVRARSRAISAGVSEAATATGSAASEVLRGARELDQQAGTLRTALDGFLRQVRAG